MGCWNAEVSVEGCGSVSADAENPVSVGRGFWIGRAVGLALPSDVCLGSSLHKLVTLGRSGRNEFVEKGERAELADVHCHTARCVSGCLMRMLADDSTAWPRPKAPVAGFAEFVCAGKNKSAPQRADLEEKGGPKRRGCSGPPQGEAGWGTLHLCVAKGHSWGEGPWLTYSQ